MDDSALQPSRREILWRQYALHVELFRSYLELLLKFNVFFYGITGAIVSYYLTSPSRPSLRYVLALPFVMSVGFSVLSAYGAWVLRHVARDVRTIAQSLELDSYPAITFLTVLLLLNAITFFLVAVGLLFLFFWPIPR